MARVLATELYNDYEEWCERQGIGDREVMTSTAFRRALGDRQILKGGKDRDGRTLRRGAQLRRNDGLIDPPIGADLDEDEGP